MNSKQYAHWFLVIASSTNSMLRLIIDETTKLNAIDQMKESEDTLDNKLWKDKKMKKEVSFLRMMLMDLS